VAGIEPTPAREIPTPVPEPEIAPPVKRPRKRE